MNNNQIKIASAGTGVFVAGGLGGYFVAKKRLEAHYRAIADEEIESVKASYLSQEMLRKNGPFATPGETAEALGVEVDLVDQETIDRAKALVGDLGYVTGSTFVDGEDQTGDIVVDTPDGEGIEVHIGTVNIFENQEEITEQELKWDPKDHEGEMEPYEVPVGYFMANDAGEDIICLSYYEDDNTLADERDQIVDDVDRTVGLINLNRFGNLSQDENIVYVRNERIDTLIEVSRVDGAYANLVLGIDESQLDQDTQERRARKKKRNGDRED